MIHTRRQIGSPWERHAVWYRVDAGEVTETEQVTALISDGARLGFRVLMVPAFAPDDNPNYVSEVMSRANRRDIRILVDISSASLAAQGRPPMTMDLAGEIIPEWFAKGARGVDLGEELLAVHGHHTHAGLEIAPLLGLVEILDPEALVTIGLKGDDRESLLEHLHDDFLHLVRTNSLGQVVLTPENFGERLAAVYELQDAVGAIPAFTISHEALDGASGRLSPSGVLLVTLALSGVVSLERGVMDRSPSSRHALRIRDAYFLARSSVALDEGLAGRGVLSMYCGSVQVIMNFGWDSYVLPDAEVLVSSLITLPEEDGKLVLPSGEVAWLAVTVP